MNLDEMLKLENQLCFAFYACSREITKLYRPILQELGLTYTQYITMLVLWEKDSIGVKELGSRLFLDSGTLTPLLKKLEAARLITRTRDQADERNVIIQLTEEGRELKQKAYEVPFKLYADTKVSESDIVSLREHIQSFVQKLI